MNLITIPAYNTQKPWDQCDSNCFIAKAAGDINRERGAVVLSVAQGIEQQLVNGIPQPDIQAREVENAFSAVDYANRQKPGTVWGLIFTNEYTNNPQDAYQVLELITRHQARARQKGLKVGTRIRNCYDIYPRPGNTNQDALQRIAKASDFIMCNLYTDLYGKSNVQDAVDQVTRSYFSARDGMRKFGKENLEVLIGETG